MTNTVSHISVNNVYYGMNATYVYAIVIIITWSLNPILTRYGSTIISINAYTILSMMAYFVGITTIVSIYDKNVWHEIHDKTNIKLVVAALTDGVCLLALPFFLYNILISQSDSIGIVVITTWTTAPLLTTIWSYFIYKQSLHWLQIVGIVITLIGIVTMNIKTNQSQNIESRRLLEIVG